VVGFIKRQATGEKQQLSKEFVREKLSNNFGQRRSSYCRNGDNGKHYRTVILNYMKK
jgi:hypothetical protein